ncbi:MAG: type II toxin-antitoxin system HipA family toxin [Alphaproteobacteria bacterium]|nr:type II toxin-antitoxin system HipA family toxin [Alphaproteobacteria bacterium]
MARPRTHSYLNVFINGRLVGLLHSASSGAIDFRYDPSWLTWDNSFPISLSLPLREDSFQGQPVKNVFDNLLPDNDAIRRRIAARVGAEGEDFYSLLSVLGRDCVGALQFLPDGVDPETVGAANGIPVSDSDIAETLASLERTPLGIDRDNDFRISIAGAQEKTALLRKDGQWYRPTGISATTHILKPQIGTLPNGIDLSNSVENEFLCSRLIAAFGIATATVELAQFGDQRTLIVERFDRLWSRDHRLLRLPQEDFCQALSKPSSQKYQADGGPGLTDLIGLLRSSDRADQDIATVLRAAILFWMLGATDGHAKNFSIMLYPGGRFHLAPLYDVLSAQPSVDLNLVRHGAFKLAMAVGKNRHYQIETIAARHFIETATAAGVGRSVIKALLDEIANTAEATVEAEISRLPAGMPDTLVTSVQAGVKRRAALLRMPS